MIFNTIGKTKNFKNKTKLIVLLNGFEAKVIHTPTSKQNEIKIILFQTTFNEYGLCYTFNNVDQGMQDRFANAEKEDLQADLQQLNLEQKPVEKKRSPLAIRKVTGCGRNHGFQLVVDSQQMMTLLPKAHLALGFKVFVTLPGVVTSRVPFHVDPGFYGEHNFFLHGIHDIKVSQDEKKCCRQ